MNLDYTAITAWAAVIASLAAVFSIWVEGRRSRFVHGLDVLMRYTDIYDSEAFRAKRRAVAQALLSDEKLPRNQAILDTAGADLLDHFQGLGMLLRRGVLDRDMVYSDYSTQVYYFYTALKPYIEREREASQEKEYWEDVDWLYQQLVTVERAGKPGRRMVGATQEAVIAFLQEEVKETPRPG